MIQKKGDLFTTTAKGICHGVNIDGVMGAGIAKQFRERFPDMYQGYRQLCLEGRLKPGEVFSYFDPATGLTIFNIASQDHPGANARLDWIRQGLETVAVNTDLNIVAMPLIGCGIGGLAYDGEYLDTLSGVEEFFGITLEVWTL